MSVLPIADEWSENDRIHITVDSIQCRNPKGKVLHKLETNLRDLKLYKKNFHICANKNVSLAL